MPRLARRRRQERLDDLVRDVARELATERSHVREVVLARVLRHRDVAAGRRAHARHLVGRDGRADAGTIDHDAQLALATRHGLGHGARKIRIVDGVLVASAEIDRDETERLEPTQHLELERETAVVAADRDASTGLASAALDSM